MSKRRVRDAVAVVIAVASVLVFGVAPVSAAPVSDTFNRANGTDLGAGWTETGTDLAISGNRVTNPATSAGFAQAVGGTGDTVEADVAAGNPGAAQYAALAVSVTDTSDLLWGAAVDEDSDGTFDHVSLRRGNNSGTVLVNQAVTEFVTGHMTVRFNGVVVAVEISTSGDSAPEITVTSAVDPVPSGTGVGFGLSGGAFLDNFVSSTTVAGTATSVTSTPTSSTYGQSVTFTATVTSGGGIPTGTVVFTVDGTDQSPSAVDGTGVAQLTTSSLGVASHTVSARFVPDGGPFALSAGDPIDHVVSVAGTSTSVASSANPAGSGESVTFTATVTGVSGTPTGPVVFTIDAVDTAPVALEAGGTATYTTSALTAGSHTVEARYEGSATHSASSTTEALVQVVTAAVAPPADGSPEATSATGGLAFTGIDVELMAMGATLLVGLGLVLGSFAARRRGRLRLES